MCKVQLKTQQTGFDIQQRLKTFLLTKPFSPKLIYTLLPVQWGVEGHFPGLKRPESEGTSLFPCSQNHDVLIRTHHFVCLPDHLASHIKLS